MRIGRCWVAATLVACGPAPTPTASPTPRPVPVSTAPPTVTTVQVAVERDVACARRSDGSVWCWGDLFRGFSPHAVRVKGLPPAKDIAVSDERACIVAEEDGSVWCWGRAMRGDERLGDPTVPRRVSGLPPAERIALRQGNDTTRTYHGDPRAPACVLDLKGSLWCWLDGDPPIHVGGDGASELAMGANTVCTLQDKAHHCAVLNFGRPLKLQVMRHHRPVVTLGMAGASRCGHFEHGILHCWGHMCGPKASADGCDVGTPAKDVQHIGGGLERLLVSDKAALHDVVYIPSFGGNLTEARIEEPFVAADGDGPWYACGVRTSGETSCWGWPRIGAISFDDLQPFARLDGPVEARYRVPLHALVAVSREAFCGADEQGDLRCWGRPRLAKALGHKQRKRIYGSVLAGAAGAVRAHLTTINFCLVFPDQPGRCLSRNIGSVMKWRDTSASAMHHRTACGAFGAERELRCRISSTRETLMTDEAGPVHDIEQIAVRGRQLCAVRDGRVLCYDREKKRMVPVQGLPDNVREVAVGAEHRCALAGGQVWCWGRSHHGQLGDVRLRNSKVPVRVEGLAGIQHIAASFQHSCAVDGASAMYCWGGNMYGQLGDRTRMSRARPVRVQGLAGVLGLALDDAMTCAIRRDDTVCWGQGAWHAFDPNAENRVPEPQPPAPIAGIGQTPPAVPEPRTVDVKLP